MSKSYKFITFILYSSSTDQLQQAGIKFKLDSNKLRVPISQAPHVAKQLKKANIKNRVLPTPDSIYIITEDLSIPKAFGIFTSKTFSSAYLIFPPDKKARNQVIKDYLNHKYDSLGDFKFIPATLSFTLKTSQQFRVECPNNPEDYPCLRPNVYLVDRDELEQFIEENGGKVLIPPNQNVSNTTLSYLGILENFPAESVLKVDPDYYTIEDFQSLLTDDTNKYANAIKDLLQSHNITSKLYDAMYAAAIENKDSIKASNDQFRTICDLVNSELYDYLQGADDSDLEDLCQDWTSDDNSSITPTQVSHKTLRPSKETWIEGAPPANDPMPMNTCIDLQTKNGKFTIVAARASVDKPTADDSIKWFFGDDEGKEYVYICKKRTSLFCSSDKILILNCRSSLNSIPELVPHLQNNTFFEFSTAKTLPFVTSFYTTFFTAYLQKIPQITFSNVSGNDLSFPQKLINYLYAIRITEQYAFFVKTRAEHLSYKEVNKAYAEYNRLISEEKYILKQQKLIADDEIEDDE